MYIHYGILQFYQYLSLDQLNAEMQTYMHANMHTLTNISIITYDYSTTINMIKRYHHCQYNDNT